MKKLLLIISIIILLTLSLFVLTGCGKKNKAIVGQWENSSFIYTFNEDKTGTYDIAGTIKNFTYEDDGSKVSILYIDDTKPMEYEYRIEGDKLIIKDSFGDDVEYTKQ